MAVKGPSRGYLVEFVEKPPEEIQTDCPICFHVIFEPKLALCCQNQSFCSACISNTEEEGKPCPLCSNQIKLVDDKRLERTLNGYAVYCPHKDKGCEWTGELGQLEKHLNRQESAATTEELMKGCQFQVIQCGVCQSHQCERRLLSDHISSGCPDVLIECEYHYTGCEFKKPQREMEVHMRDSVTIHLSLVSKSTRNSLFQKDREIEELKAELRQLKTDLQQQKDTNNTQTQEVRQQYNELSQEVQHHRTKQLREFKQWRRNSDHHWMWLLLLIAGVGVVHGLLYHSSSEANTICEKIKNELMHIKIPTTTLKQNLTEVTNGTFKEKFDEIENKFKNLTMILEEKDTNNKLMQEIRQQYKGLSEEVQRQLREFRQWRENYTEIEQKKFDEVEIQIKKLTTILKENFTVIERNLHEKIKRLLNEIPTPNCDCSPPSIATKDFQHMKNEIQYLGQQVDFPILPVHINLTQVERIKKDKPYWLSMPFYTHQGGYKMRLVVYPDGTQSGRGRHISVAIRLMNGKYDDLLEWPLNITLNVTLLSQNFAQNNIKRTYTLSKRDSGKASAVERVHNEIMAKEEVLIPQFAPQRSQYFKDDQLHFVVEKDEKITTKSWYKFW